MNITCKASNVASDVRCAVCGQGFLVNWTNSGPTERARQFAAVMSVLRMHHGAMSSERAHPACEFCLPDVESQKAEPAPLFLVPATLAA